MQNLLKHNAEQGGETAVYGSAEKAHPDLSPETRAKEEDLWKMPQKDSLSELFRF